MTRAVAKTSNQLPAEISDLVAGLGNMQNVSRSDNVGQSGTSFMKFSGGVFTYGAENLDVEEDSKWAVNPNSFLHGYQAWGDGELLGEERATMAEPPIVRGNLDALTYVHPDHGEVNAKWQPLRGMQLVCVSGADKGTACELAGTSMGLTKAIAGLITEVMAAIKEDPQTPVPIVLLGSDSYYNKKWKKDIFFPVFDVVDWLGLEATEIPPDTDEDESGGEDQTEDETGNEDKGDETENKTEDEEPPAKPTRRRQRRAKAS